MDETFFWRARSIQELSQYIGSTEAFIRSEIKSGRLRARTLNTRYIRILPEDIRAWLDAGLKKSPGYKTKAEQAQDAGSDTPETETTSAHLTIWAGVDENDKQRIAQLLALFEQGGDKADEASGDLFREFGINAYEVGSDER
jgi:hypothetical protein